jgi:hypothetical protein
VNVEWGEGGGALHRLQGHDQGHGRPVAFWGCDVKARLVTKLPRCPEQSPS